MAEKKVLVKKDECSKFLLTGMPGESWVGISCIDEAKTGARTFRMGLLEIEPGKKAGLHCHDCEEAMYVLEGKGAFEIDGKYYEAEPGDSVFVKSGEPHGRHKNLGDKTFRYIYVTGPVVNLYEAGPLIRPQVPEDNYLPGGGKASVKVEEIK